MGYIAVAKKRIALLEEENAQHQATLSRVLPENTHLKQKVAELESRWSGLKTKLQDTSGNWKAGLVEDEQRMMDAAIKVILNEMAQLEKIPG